MEESVGADMMMPLPGCLGMSWRLPHKFFRLTRIVEAFDIIAGTRFSSFFYISSPCPYWQNYFPAKVAGQRRKLRIRRKVGIRLGWLTPWPNPTRTALKCNELGIVAESWAPYQLKLVTTRRFGSTERNPAEQTLWIQFMHFLRS